MLNEETTHPVDDVDPPFLPEPTVLVRRERQTPALAVALDFADRFRRELFGLGAIVVAAVVGLAYVARVEQPADPLQADQRDRLSAFAPLIDDVSTTDESTGAGSTDGPPAGGPRSLTPAPLDVERATTTDSGSTTPTTRASTTSTRSLSSSQPPTTAATSTEPPTTQPPTTEPPTTQAPTTEPPTTQAPSTQAPTTEPPTTEPPTTTTPVGAPVAKADAAQTEEEKEIKIAVLDNDDPGSSSFDEDTLVLVTLPQHADEARVHGDHIHYKSVEDFEGVDTMAYRICNDDGLCDVALVLVTVEDD